MNQNPDITFQITNDHTTYMLTLINVRVGLVYKKESINKELAKYYPLDYINNYQIISGLINNKTTSFPLSIIYTLPNKISTNYVLPNDINHYLSYNKCIEDNVIKYDIFYFLLSICGLMYKEDNISKDLIISSHIYQVHTLIDKSFIESISLSNNDLIMLDNDPFSSIDKRFKILFNQLLKKAKSTNKTYSGVIETIIKLPNHIKEHSFYPSFDNIKSRISSTLFMINDAISVEFGKGKVLSTLEGSEVVDELSFINDELTYLSNNLGGVINGCITNDIIVKTSFLPVASSHKEYKSIDITNLSNVLIKALNNVETTNLHKRKLLVSSLINMMF